MEKHMRELCNNTDSQEYSALMLAYSFWQITDYITQSNKADIFKYLYLTPIHFKDTFLKISMDLKISLRTLERYRKVFVISFKAALLLLSRPVNLLKAG